jgi:hypothetical protein
VYRVETLAGGLRLLNHFPFFRSIMHSAHGNPEVVLTLRRHIESKRESESGRVEWLAISINFGVSMC